MTITLLLLKISKMKWTRTDLSKRDIGLYMAPWAGSMFLYKFTWSIFLYECEDRMKAYEFSSFLREVAQMIDCWFLFD